jgi:hypothetical protein
MLLRPTWSIDPAARSQLRQDAKNRIAEIQGKTVGTGPSSAGVAAGAGVSRGSGQRVVPGTGATANPRRTGK